MSSYNGTLNGHRWGVDFSLSEIALAFTSRRVASVPEVGIVHPVDGDFLIIFSEH